MAKNKSSRDGKYHLINFVRNWLHQALSYMDRGELLFRLLSEAIIIWIIYYSINLAGSDSHVYSKLMIAVVSAHTLYWLFNGNFWALYLFAIPSAQNPGVKVTEEYLERMKKRLGSSRCVGGLALYGSAARGEWHSKSDLDIRVIRNRGFLNWLCSNVLVFRERIIAFVRHQPADLFLADNVSFLGKMRKDELPVFLIKNMSALEREYPGNKEVSGAALSLVKRP